MVDVDVMIRLRHACSYFEISLSLYVDASQNFLVFFFLFSSLLLFFLMPCRRQITILGVRGHFIFLV